MYMWVARENFLHSVLLESHSLPCKFFEFFSQEFADNVFQHIKTEWFVHEWFQQTSNLKMYEYTRGNH